MKTILKKNSSCSLCSLINSNRSAYHCLKIIKIKLDHVFLWNSQYSFSSIKYMQCYVIIWSCFENTIYLFSINLRASPSQGFRGKQMHSFQSDTWVPISHVLVWKSQAMDVRKRSASIMYRVISTTSDRQSQEE